jgi:hypothetical protein
MEFLNPAILWGLIALGIPVLIHLWNGRQGIKIAWAASRFLEENENKPVRHIKFEQWLLLLLRLLLLTLLLLILAKLFWDKLDKDEEIRVMHLVEPSGELLSEFRFELQQALNNGEEVFLLDQDQNRLGDLDQFTMESKNKPVRFGNLLTQKEEIPEEIHLYLSGNESSFASFFYPVSVMPTLHVAQFSSSKNTNNLIQLNGDKILFINEINQIEISDKPILNSGQVYDSSFNYYIDLKSEKHAEIIEASLKSIQEVYNLEFNHSEEEDAQLHFTDRSMIDPKPDRIYWKIGDFEQAQFDNFYHLRAFERGALSMEAYEEIPEQIMTDLLDFLEIRGEDIRLNESQIQSRFHLLDLDQKTNQANTFEILWLLFLLVLVVERVLSNKSRL